MCGENECGHMSETVKINWSIFGPLHAHACSLGDAAKSNMFQENR